LIQFRCLGATLQQLPGIRSDCLRLLEIRECHLRVLILSCDRLQDDHDGNADDNRQGNDDRRYERRPHGLFPIKSRLATLSPECAGKAPGAISWNTSLGEDIEASTASSASAASS
jgi:hypothetical protein